MTETTILHPDLVWLDGRFRPGKSVRLGPDGTIASIGDAGPAGDREPETVSLARGEPGAGARPVIRLEGKALLPGFVNAHSHAFQRLIRGRTQWRRNGADDEDFWSWREAMYGAALELSAEDVYDVSRWCFIEMMRTGITAVGEFHYLHHQPDGRPYADRNELAHRVMAAAESVGLRIVLLNVCYATGGIGREPGPRQRRFVVPSPERFLEWTEALLDSGEERSGLVTVGVAPHSIRALPREWLPEIRAFAAEREMAVHMHVAEQPAEVEACVAAYGLRPVELLAEDGLLEERFTAVHATHLTDAEIGMLARSGARVCACPTTERDLGDGFLRGADLVEAGVEICLGTDSHTNLDFLAEMRLVEYHERLRRQARVVIAGGGAGEGVDAEADAGSGEQAVSVAPPLLDMATRAGALALRLNGGEVAAGRDADLVAVDLGHPSLVGWTEDTLAAMLALSATPDVVRDVWVAGARRLTEGRHPAEDAAAAAFTRVAERVG